MSMSLPGIHEMFPEYLVEHSSSLFSQSSSGSDESSCSMNSQRIASTVTTPNPTSRPGLLPSTEGLRFHPSHHFHPSSTQRHPLSARPYHRERDCEFSSQLSNPDTLSEESSDQGEDKRHECTICHKHFSRPSAVRIHMNIHTGATPFLCPYPNCGQEFNVKSNMARHYKRSHSKRRLRSEQSLGEPEEEASRTSRSSGTTLDHLDLDSLSSELS